MSGAWMTQGGTATSAAARTAAGLERCTPAPEEQAFRQHTVLIAVDMPLVVERIVVHSVRDGATSTLGEAGETLSCWVVWVGEPDTADQRQINASVPAECDWASL